MNPETPRPSSSAVRLLLAATLLLGLAFGLWGCVTTDVTLVGGVRYKPRDDDARVDVYIPDDALTEIRRAVPGAKTSADLPAQARVIARITSSGSPSVGWGKMIDDAQKNARKLGGEAVAVTGWGRPIVKVNDDGIPTHGRSLNLSVLRISERP